jgi:hypothetical protein
VLTTTVTIFSFVFSTAVLFVAPRMFSHTPSGFAIMTIASYIAAFQLADSSVLLLAYC